MFIFPAHILTPRKPDRFIEQQTLTGGAAIEAGADVVLNDGGGRWVIEYNEIPLVTAEQARVWAAWLAYLDGGATECLVPMLSLATSPRAETNPRRPQRMSALVYDDREWPTALGYALRNHEAAFAAGGALRATSASFDVTRGGDVTSGQVFSTADGRAYLTGPPDGAGGFSIRPPLRAAVSAGDSAVFDFPLCRARMAPNERFSIPLDRGKAGEVSIRFVESV